MAIPLPPLAAFRADRAAGTSTPSDGVWLQVALLTSRAAALPPTARATHLGAIRELTGRSGDEVDAIIATALEMEDAATFRLALSTLDGALGLLPRADVERRGLVLAYQGRVLRQMGEVVEASGRYEAVMALGEEYGLPALVARGEVGLGLLARFRGNMPAARRHFERALATAEVAPDTIKAARQGLMICAGDAGDFDAAARHAWMAFEGATGADRIVALVDLSTMLLKGGEPRAAVSGFAAAAREELLPRYELPVLGGLAIAAARSLEEDLALPLVRAADRRLDELLARGTLPYLSAATLADLGDAWVEIGDAARAADRRRAARELASRHGYHEILFRLEGSDERDRRRARQDQEVGSRAPWEIVTAVAALGPRDRLAETALALAGA